MDKSIVYYECLNDAVYASYEIPINKNWWTDDKINLVNLDSCSDGLQFQLVHESINQSLAVLLVIDSRNGISIHGLIQLINLLKKQNHDLIWIGEHDFAHKAVTMAHGVQIQEITDLKAAVLDWIRES